METFLLGVLPKDGSPFINKICVYMLYTGAAPSLIGPNLVQIFHFYSAFITALYCIPEYRDCSPAKIGSPRIMNIFLIFIFILCRKSIGMGSCYVMWCLFVFERFWSSSKKIFINPNRKSNVLKHCFSTKKLSGARVN